MSKRRGRPPGATPYRIADAALIRSMREMMAADPGLSKTAAAKRLVGVHDTAAIRRLQHKFSRDKA